MDWNIRNARKADAEAINRIFNEAVETGGANLDIDTKDTAYRQKWLAAHDKRHPVIVCEKDGEVIGWASISPWGSRYTYDWVGELSIYVAREHRGQGLGSELLRRLEKRAEETGYCKLMMQVFATNYPALHAYRTAGYRDVGTMRCHGFYKGAMEDIAVLERILPYDEEKLKAYYKDSYPFYKEYFRSAEAPKEKPKRDPNKKLRVIE